MAPDVAERHAVALAVRPGQIAPSRRARAAQDRRRRRARRRARAQQAIEQAAGRAVRAEQVGPRRSAAPSARSSRTRPRGRPADCRARPGTRAPGVAASSSLQRRGVDAQRLARVGREARRLEHAQARDARGLRSARASLRSRLAVAPLRAGAGVEQHADDDQIDQRARASRRRAARCRPRARPSGRRRPRRSAASGCEAGCRRSRIARARHVGDDAAPPIVQAGAQVDAKVRELAARRAARAIALRSARASPRGDAQLPRASARRAHRLDAHSSSPRPLALASSPRVGIGPSVK